MDPRLSLVSLGVRDVAASRRFYIDGLGWNPAFEVPGSVLFVQAAHGLLLAFWSVREMAEDALLDSEGGPSAAGRPAPVTLSHNVADAARVDEVLAEAQRAGATLIRPGAKQPWGGYSGYFADPDGFRWEVAWNPYLTVEDDGTVRLTTAESP